MDAHKKSIAFFDFDGTVTKKDSFLEMIKRVKGEKSFLLGFALLSPWMIGMKLKIISKQVGKEKVLKYFFGGQKLSDFHIQCDWFAREKLPEIVRPKAMKQIYNHLDDKVTVVIVTASPGNYIEPWAQKNNLLCIATRLEVIDGKITGKIQGKNCNGEEKIKRISESFDLSSYDFIYAYGDTDGDKPMLELADFSSYKPFRE